MIVINLDEVIFSLFASNEIGDDGSVMFSKSNDILSVCMLIFEENSFFFLSGNFFNLRASFSWNDFISSSLFIYFYFFDHCSS